MVIFSATATLALEVLRSREPDSQLGTAITQGELLLEKVKSHNKLASEALSMIAELKAT